jgi:S-methylmethionine-dependent homocysteine/selenocysteine methylase
VDTRNVMSKGTAEEVVEEVKKVIGLLSPGGGHLLCSNHTIQATARAVDNTIAFYWAALAFRNYPIRIEKVSEEVRMTRVV